MRVVIIADVYPPLRSSGAVQLRDLSREFVRQGHDTTVLIASPNLSEPYQIETLEGVTVARLQTLQTKDVGYVKRTVGELLMPFFMKKNYRKSSLAEKQYDLVIWYSPTIFLGPIVRWLKKQSGCPSYLIIRDIFPQWAADMGLISRGPAYQFLDQIAQYQYRSADTIGVQTIGNMAFFKEFEATGADCTIEVLQNWLGPAPVSLGSIDLSATKLAGRRIFVYAGNMGIAQDMDKLTNLAAALQHRSDIGFLFIGRGSELSRLKADAEKRGDDNILFIDEIAPDEIPALYKQCDVGMISLDHRHNTHNIPGKFLTYMQAGLPVLASINPENDLSSLVKENGVGRVSIDKSGNDLPKLAEEMVCEEMEDEDIRLRCAKLSDELFSVKSTVQQILKSAQT